MVADNDVIPDLVMVLIVLRYNRKRLNTPLNNPLMILISRFV